MIKRLTYISLSILGILLAACQHIPPVLNEIMIEAEDGFTNNGEFPFVREEESFYSNGTAIKLASNTPVGGSGEAAYDLAGRVPAGTYNLSIVYNDENDGHSPVSVYVDQQHFEFVMDDETQNAFASEDNQRTRVFENVVVTDRSELRVSGTVHRYQSDHKELVRLDRFVFTQQ